MSGGVASPNSWAARSAAVERLPRCCAARAVANPGGREMVFIPRAAAVARGRPGSGPCRPDVRYVRGGACWGGGRGPGGPVPRRLG